MLRHPKQRSGRPSTEGGVGFDPICLFGNLPPHSFFLSLHAKQGVSILLRSGSGGISIEMHRSLQFSLQIGPAFEA